MSRFNHLLNMYREQRMKERKNRILSRSRASVENNAHGTSGYFIKHGVNAGQIMHHSIIAHQNKSY